MAKRSARTPQQEPLNPPFDVVCLVTSAGGLDALSTVLRDLPPDFPAAVLVMQHIGGQASTLAQILARRAQLPVEWASDGATILPGQVLVCPPRFRLEVLPDRTCTLLPNERGARDKPLDALLESLADSYRSRALAIILTGMGKDGATGALALKQAGGIVLAQSEDTAEQPSMPRATANLGAADLVLPLHEIAPVLLTLMSGGQLPRPRREIAVAEALFTGPGELPGLLRDINWAQTPLGPVSKWPPALSTAVHQMLESPMAEIILWGPDLVQLYNDHYRALMGEKHPAGLGQMNRICWNEVWHLNEPIYQRVMTGQQFSVEDKLYPLTRHGYVENAWFTLYYTPIKDEIGATVGVLQTCFETTSRVLAERRLRILHLLATQSTGSISVAIALQQALKVLAEDNQDLPFVLGYLLDTNRLRAQLSEAVGVDAGGPMAPQSVELSGGHPAWPLAKVVDSGSPVRLDDLTSRFRGIHASPDPETPNSALLLPLISKGEGAPEGILIIGLSTRLPFDAEYQEFIELVKAQINANLNAARIRQKEREQLERLRELDRIKTEFFSNISHEFRTPLTLMLAPLEAARSQREALPPLLAEEMDLAARNARRLLTLVNNLLDFSQIEAGRLRANFQPTDLAKLTADLASLFRSAAEGAGLHLRVNCPPLPQPVWVDREMWEKIVSNLLSNALKFTFNGEISVELHSLPQHVELVVRDTGVGIPEAEIPHLFQRFHRVQGTPARTREGAGIGLAMVNELVRQHHGRVRVQSKVGEGTTFTIWIPRGERVDGANREPKASQEEASARQPQPDAASAEEFENGSLPRQAAALAEAAEHWNGMEAANQLSEDLLEEPVGLPKTTGLQNHQAGARVLIVDDNPDMRDYLQRLLSPRWQVISAMDGLDAWEHIHQEPPDLVLADVMMPNIDGFALLKQIRADEAVKDIPVILLTARAGEEAAIEGLLAGADDYIAKPFSARELVARISGQLELARLRRRMAAVNAFRVALHDTLRPLADTAAIQNEASRLLGEYLGADRVLFVVFEADGNTIHYQPGYERQGVPSNAALRRKMTQFGPEPMRQLTAGQTLIVADIDAQPGLTPEERAAYTTVAFVAVPLIRQGKLQMFLAVHQQTPRQWTAEEVALIEEVTERIWLAVERVRVEEALRKSEAQYRMLYEAIDEGFMLSEVIFDEQDRPIDILFHDANPTATRILGMDYSGHRLKESNPDVEPFWFDIWGRVARSGVGERLERYDTPNQTWWSFYIYRIGGPNSRMVANVFQDITERKRAEEALRESEERQSFLLKLSDALRPLSEPVAIEETVTRIAMDFFQADRCYYCVIDGDRSTISRDAARGGLPSVAGVYDLNTIPIFKAVLDAGRPFVVRNAYTSDLLDEPLRQLCIQLQVISFVDVPVIKDGQPVGLLCIVQSTPRDWNDLNEELAVETAERTWSAVERARSEASLRKSEEYLRLNEKRMRGQKEAFQAAINGAPLEETLNILTRMVVEETAGKARTAFYTVDPDGSCLHPILGAGNMPIAYVKQVDGFLVAKDGLACGLAAATSHPVLYRDVFDEEVWQPWLHLAREFDYRACWSFPIETRDGKMMGTFAMYFQTPREAGPHDFALANVVTQTAGILISRNMEIQERQRAQEKLSKSEERFRTSIENLTEAFIIYSAIRRNGEIVDLRYEYVNDQACAFHHLPREQLIGHTILEIIPAVKETGLFDQYVQVIETGQPQIGQQDVPTKEGGKTRAHGVYNYRVSKFRDGMIITANDVTE